MSIDNQTVRKVSKLAKIKINEKEETKFIEELNNILGWVDELKKVDTEQIEPMLSVFNESMVMRKDEVSSETLDELVLKNAPESKSGFFVVPKVIE
ncbi:MAG: Asp-tRNA(Asn)/Glu-tRNA(Gln) amidotransferase GatCAB subunit C [Rickettsiales bacterium]|nr:Asp-tRNA(Asn)/Glu-tRNA(Gln) amidotransferase GatCAB subunit C [Rickettsiales bacterium]RPG14468.1 MAG: Asp-tRNA(Asn)/Glu-tRNA(Gln) amidotransferase subunit GatC [Pelagibacteraceae bacterium TMED195]|tara:strand:+ start:520 stop:807 length:288 start_codon:yes stop_codon:yes gene_type:complete